MSTDEQEISTLDAANKACEQVERDYDDISASAYDDDEEPGQFSDGFTARIILARQTLTHCESCGQRIPPGRARRGVIANQCGGCNWSNHPVEVHTVVDDAADVDDAIEQLLVDLDEAVSAAVDDEAETVRAQLVDELRKFLADDGDVTDFSDLHDTWCEPGICTDDGEVVAWDYDPRDGTESIIVRESDLD